MNFDFPWSVKGIRPEARETAQEAARRAGLPLGDWLNAIILQQAATQGVRVPSLNRRGDEGISGDRSNVHRRLDDLTRHIDQVTHSGPVAYAPRRSREESDQFGELPGRAMATAAPAPGPVPAQDLSGLEGQLRRITNQIEMLRRPGVEKAVTSLRAELGEIGRTLNEAMPRRAIETIENQVQGVNQRVVEGRQAGVDNSALAGIEHGLAEVRDALRGLMPAENLVGYTEAIDALAHKIDLIVVQKDPATMQQLASSIRTLREMATHVASDETVTGLSTQVQALADKIDHLAIGAGVGEALNKLELRIDALSRAMAECAQNGDAVPPRLEALIQSLSDKIEQIQQSRGDQIALGHFEDCIVKLAERLNATDSRLSHLAAIERGLADLLLHIEDIRANKETAGFRAESASGIDLLKQDMARTQDTLEAVHGALDRVTERLAMIEKDIRGDRPGPAARETEILELTQPEPSVRAPEPVRPSYAEFSNFGLQPASPVAIDSTPHADQLLEPGSGRPDFGASPGVRIAASEAALGAARPATTTPSNKSSFIAAARRAAQAAGQDPKSRQARPESFRKNGSERTSPKAKIGTRVKSMFLAASVVAIIVGSIQFASNIFDFGIFDTNETKVAAPSPETDTANGGITEEAPESETSAALVDGQPASPSAPALGAADADTTASLLAPPTLPSLTPALPPPLATAAPAQPPLNLNEIGKGPLPILNPPALNAPFLGTAPGPKADITGSIARAPAAPPATRQPAPAAQPSADGLPAAIGGPQLRNAALAGDPAAAYEVAMRFVEGRGVPANLEQAARWYERAARKGLAPAQFRYASMLEKGQGVKKDLSAAHKLYVAAAAKGHAKAMHNLAVLYAEGAVGAPDYANAAQWFRKAAEHGVADSQYNLGVLTTRGLGTEKNIAESYKWFALAAAQGDRDAGRKRDEVAALLNSQTLGAAQQAAKSFTVQVQPTEAILVPEPPGGWDSTTSPPNEKPRAAGPLSINSGKL
jgi:localization factor PodJL